MGADISRCNVFVSYSRNDRFWLDAMKSHLKPMVREEKISLWEDSVVDPGRPWKEDLTQALENAQIAVFLVSASLIASDFIYEHELKPILSSAKEKGVHILSVIVRPCSFRSSALYEYQAVNDPDMPMSEMEQAKQEWVWVKLVDSIERIRSGSSSPQPVAAPVRPHPDHPETAVITKTPTVELELTIEGDLDNFDETQKATLMEAIHKMTELSDVKIKRIREGSIKVTIELPPHLAERVKWAVKQGSLEDLGVRDAEILENEHDAMDEPDINLLTEFPGGLTAEDLEKASGDPALLNVVSPHKALSGPGGFAMHTFRNMDTIISDVHDFFELLEYQFEMSGESLLERIYTAKLIVHEWVANLIQYLDFAAKSPVIELHVKIVGDIIHCTIEDNSIGFDLNHYFKVNRHLPVELPEKGMSLLLVREAARQLGYQRLLKGTNLFEFVV